MIKYVLGFAFEEGNSRVLMIRKKRPAWQAGKLNGIGGKIEPDELASAAMVREFEEGTGLKTDPSQWKMVAQFGGDQFSCTVFKTTLAALKFQRASTVTDEQVVGSPTSHVILYGAQYLKNIPHLIGLCLDQELDGVQHITYRSPSGPQL